MAKIGGMNFDVNVGDLLVHVESCTLDITDNSSVAQTRACPTGTWTVTLQQLAKWSWTPRTLTC